MRIRQSVDQTVFNPTATINTSYYPVFHLSCHGAVGFRHKNVLVRVQKLETEAQTTAAGSAQSLNVLS